MAFGFSLDGLSLYPIRRATNETWTLVAFDVNSGKERRRRILTCRQGRTFQDSASIQMGRASLPRIGIARHDIWLLEGFKQPSRWMAKLSWLRELRK